MRPLGSAAAEQRRQARFLLLAVCAVLAGCAVLALGWLVPTMGFAALHPQLASVIGWLCLGAGLGALGITLGLVCVVRFPDRPDMLSSLKSLKAWRGWRTVLRTLLPIVETLARIRSTESSRHADEPSRLDDIRRAFIEINNTLVLREKRYGKVRCTPESLLILLPHCLQASHCPHRLTHNLDNCRRCGKCTLRDFLHLRDTLGVRLAVASGGTIARRIVRRDRPEVIVAVACERDLSAGIQDTAPLPVYGVLNERPMGPCMDTTVTMERVEAALRLFLG